MVVIENDLTRRLPVAQVKAAFDKAETVIVLDLVKRQRNFADIVLSAASFAGRLTGLW